MEILYCHPYWCQNWNIFFSKKAIKTGFWYPYSVLSAIYNRLIFMRVLWWSWATSCGWPTMDDLMGRTPPLMVTSAGINRFCVGCLDNLRGIPWSSRSGAYRYNTPRKTNMSPQNQWLEDIVPFWGTCSFSGVYTDVCLPLGRHLFV